MLGRGKEEHAKRIAAEEAAAAKKAAEEEQQAKDEGLDAVTVALDRIGQSLKIINEDMTEDWGKTGLVRQQVKRAKAELRSNLVKAAKEMQRFAAGRREGDAEPPYMEMVDVDDLKAACNVYEKRLAEEHAHVRHLERSTKQLEKETEAQKAEIEELKGLRSQIAKLEVTNTKVESDLKREKGERIQGAGREYYLEEDLREARKEIEALTEEVRSLSKERVADGGKADGISGGSLADEYDEQQKKETADLRSRVEKQDVEMERLRVTNEELTLELQQVYYSFHKPGVDTFQGWDSTTQATEASLDAMLEAGGAGAAGAAGAAGGGAAR